MSELRVDGIKGSGGGAVNTILQPGSIVQCLTQSSGFVNQTIVSATPVALTNMSITITPKFASSAIIIQAMVVASWTYVSSLHIYRNGADIIPNHGGNNQSGGATALWTHYQSSQEAARTNQVFPFPVLYKDLPNTTSATTYDLRANSGWSAGTETYLFNNRTGTDMLGTSFMTVWEVLA